MCQECEKWLNNSNKVCLSPMLHYLKNAEHENVPLRNDVKVGKTAFECSHCRLSNELVLGFASVESNSVAVVLSRQMDEPCNRQWKELSDGIHFLSFMVKVPGAASKKLPSENRVCVTHTSTVATTILDLSEVPNSQVQPEVIPLRFTNGSEYANDFIAALNLNADCFKFIVESSQRQFNVTLCWVDLPKRKVRANFIMAFDDKIWGLRLGDKLKLSCIGPKSNWTGVGRVVKLPHNYDDNVGLVMEKSEDIPRDHTEGFSVSRVWISTTYDREVSALRKFTSDINSQNFLFKQILGTYVENNISGVFEWNNYNLPSVPSLPPLSAEQEKAVKKAIEHPLTLIRGNSASGKTVTLLSILYHLVQRNKGPILVCAQTNTVVDHLALSIHRMKLEIVRLFAATRPSEGSPTQFLSLESKIRNCLPTELKKLQKLDDGEELSSKDAKKLRDGREKTMRYILDSAEVICCTCIAAGDERLSSIKFHAILIDDSMQATEPECIIPISLGCDHLVLVGDELSLEPVLSCKKVLKTGLNRSLFERLVAIGVQPLLLTAQYRMHPKLWHHPSTHYSNPPQSGVSACQRRLPDQVFPWPIPDFPFVFYDIRSFEERSWPIKSYINRREASKVVEIVKHLLDQGISPDRIGVITQFSGQKRYLMLHMDHFSNLNAEICRKIEVDLVDAFQGREKDIIIVSCVRSEGTTGVGSLNYPSRFHLILTRAKYGLVIVGNSITLSKQKIWKDLLSFCQKQGVWVKEELDESNQAMRNFRSDQVFANVDFEE